MRRRLPALLVIALALSVVLRFTVFRPDPIEVSVAPVEIDRVEATLTNSKAGTVKARRRARLSPEVGGRIIEIVYREGHRVGAGEILVRLDSEFGLKILTERSAPNLREHLESRLTTLRNIVA